jgi:excisionase family DNA binding protein
MSNRQISHHCSNCIYRADTECPYKNFEKSMLRTEDAAKLLGKAEQTIYNWKNKGEIQSTQSGGHLLFRESQLMCRLAEGSK